MGDSAIITGTITKSLIMCGIKILPRWVSRKLYSLDDFGKDVKIKTRPNTESIFIHNTTIPLIEIYLEIENNSPFSDIEIDRIFVEAWFSQPFVSITYLAKDRIKRGTNKVILLKSPLNEFQLKEKERLNPKTIRLEIIGYFSSDIGSLTKVSTFDRVSIKID